MSTSGFSSKFGLSASPSGCQSPPYSFSSRFPSPRFTSPSQKVPGLANVKLPSAQVPYYVPSKGSVNFRETPTLFLAKEKVHSPTVASATRNLGQQFNDSASPHEGQSTISGSPASTSFASPAKTSGLFVSPSTSGFKFPSSPFTFTSRLPFQQFTSPTITKSSQSPPVSVSVALPSALVQQYVHSKESVALCNTSTVNTPKDKFGSSTIATHNLGQQSDVVQEFHEDTVSDDLFAQIDLDDTLNM